VLYGWGDFITDHERITGYERFRDDLVVMAFLQLDRDTGDLAALHMTPFQIRWMQLVRPSAQIVIGCGRDLQTSRLALGGSGRQHV
jgi:hypothetical protein